MPSPAPATLPAAAGFPPATVHATQPGKITATATRAAAAAATVTAAAAVKTTVS